MEIKEVQNRKLVLNMDSVGMIQKPTIIIVTVTVHNHNYIMKIKCLAIHGLYDNIIMAVLRIAVTLALIYTTYISWGQIFNLNISKATTCM